jgi:serine/threonine protein kinase/tetratricopeptide (TPR) repeat protein
MSLSVAENLLVARLLDLPAGQRGAALAAASAEDPTILVHRERILAATAARAHRTTDPVLSNAQAAHALGLALERPREDATGAYVGPYRLLEKIGEGGFGVVWLAEQLEPIRRRVAVKIIKLGMDTEEVITRFEAERQALALMDHPNIARVFDAGSTDSGRLYFAMELVHGNAITRYCDEHRVGTEGRLRLFMTVCDAVQHAHQKGVIHRDLKPSNILVAQQDGMPVPKVIDFGIAKATSARLTEKTLLTQLHAFIGTPAYTSPEQMEMSGLDIDTRSDIYSLGVLLYELLVGRAPFDSQALAKSGLEAMRHTIREIDPPRPSARFVTLDENDRISVARQRNAEAAKLSLLLRGDLDWIVMHCLEKNRSRRYDTVSDLSRDVERYLANEPVSARPPSATYRLQKSIRRHRVGFAAGAAILLSLVASLVMLSLLLGREREARQREIVLRAKADANASQAHTAAVKSAEVAQFMKNMLSGVAPSFARGRDATMLREVLDATAQKLDRELADQPEVAADLRDTLGAIYRDLGQYAVAEKLLREAVQARRKLNGSDSPELAASLDNYAAVLGLEGRPEGWDLMVEALAIRKKNFGDKHPLVATTVEHLSRLPAPAPRTFEEWTALRQKALAIRLEIFGPEHPDVAESIASLGVVAYQHNDLAESARLLREALAMRKKLLGADHPVLVDNLISLGWTLSEDDKWTEAEPVIREALELAIKVFPEHPFVTSTLLRLAGGQPIQGGDDASVDLARATIEAQRARLGADSPAVAVSSLALAVLLGDRMEAAEEVRRLNRDAEAVLDSNRKNGIFPAEQILLDMQLCASRRIFGGAPAQGLVLGEQLWLCSRPGTPPAISGGPLLLPAMAQFYTGHTSEARALWEQALTLLQKVEGAAPYVLCHCSLLAAANRQLGQLAEAERVVTDGLAVMKRNLGADKVPDPAVATLYCEMGLILNEQSRFVEAEKYFQLALENHDRATREKALRPRMRMWRTLRPRAETESGLGQALAGQKKFAEAEPLLLHAYATLEAERNTLGGDRTKLSREAAGRLAAFYLAWDKPEKAAPWQAALR